MSQKGLMIALAIILCSIPVLAGCTSSMKTLPAACSGTITSDTLDGCRTITCTGNDGTMQAKACDKQGYFELYRDAYTGQPPAVCIGTTCVEKNGYAKSSSSTCTSQAVQAPPKPNKKNACFTSVQEIPATCVGGDIVKDSFDGCRFILCTASCGTTSALACDKPDGPSGKKFEMYATDFSGCGPSVCLGNTCVGANSGFERSKFPVCGPFTVKFLQQSAAGWQTFMPGWVYDQGMYKGTNTGANIPVESVYTFGYNWTDYTVQANMSTQSGYAPASAELIFHYNDPSHYGQCRILQDYTETRLEIIDIQHGTLNQTVYPFAVGQWYTLKTSIVGNSVTCEVVGSPSTRLTAQWTGDPAGTVGLRATHFPVFFKDVVATIY